MAFDGLQLQRLKVDEKGRAALSVDFWRAMNPDRQGDWFVAVPGRCPRTRWLVPNRVYRQESGALPHPDMLSDELFAYLVDERSSTEELKPDPQWRVSLSDELLGELGASRKKPDNELVVTPFGDRLILWSAASYAAFKKEMNDTREERRKQVQPELRMLRQNSGAGDDASGSQGPYPAGWKTLSDSK